ncbi:MAG TPA: replicative DNA helicase, partial [Acidimicrobiales bacterium]|nr:replicative DNA helicase [Acidimicrobiales bacterium]
MADMVQSLEETRRRSRASESLAPVISTRVPPHNLEAEESVLGAMLLSRDAIAAAIERCSASDFYRPSHAQIFEAITDLYGRGEPSDVVTVAEQLRRTSSLEDVGGTASLVSLQSNTPAISSAGRYASIVEEHALLRKLIGVSREISEMAYGLPEDVTDAVDRAESMVFEVAQRRTTDSVALLQELLSQSLDRLEELYGRGESITGIPTGFDLLDHQLAGLQNSNLIVVGARPSVGKTAFALNIATHAALGGTPVLFFSLEMSHLELAQRILCSEAKVDASRMRNGQLKEADWGKVSRAIGRIGDAPLHFDDNPNVTIMDIRARARRMKSRGGLGLVVVDYLQLMTGRSAAESRQVEISEISRGLKILARELEIPVIALSQLSRNLEARADKRPMLSDLRESGAIEQDADVVMFLYRDEVYNKDAPDNAGKAEVILAKHRNGPTG